MLRTYTCGQLTASDTGKQVILCGWVANRRDHGKLIFIDIRDRYGLTQVVFIPKESGEAYKLAQGLRNEFVIKLSGLVNKRPAGTINAKLASGEVEILAQELEILNPSNTPPFEIQDEVEITEELRLKYRYLDLRRTKIFNHLLLRSNLYRIIRNYLGNKDFIECETPILTKSTPEGARDYLVPSRVNPGQFFALPQSPQLFKQILMVAGIEKYYQIAKCFRDEDLRADRQPEFTQLDIEMSFISEEDIFSLTEGLMKLIFKELKNIDIPIPFTRISYQEAMEKYKSDKPDLRKPLNLDFAFCWVVDFPLFKFNTEEKRWESEHHPFTSPASEDLENLEAAPEKVKSRSYDLVLNGIELGSGSIRIHRQELQEKIFKIVGLEKEEIQKRFGFLLEAFQFGAPPHGGVAFGLDRLLAILCGQASIREVITFPKNSNTFCPLTSAPSDVEDKQLKELGLTIRKGGNKMNSFKLAGICVLTSTLALSGCVARTYNLTRDRVDQELSSSSGNRGYLMGQAPEPQERRTTRTTRVFEVELGRTNKTICPATTPLAGETTEEPRMVQETQPDTQSDQANLSSEKYTVVKNDTLQKISKKFYGTTKRWMKIYEANKDVLHAPDKLYAGQVLNIPSGPKVNTENQKMQEPKENLK